MHAQNVRTLSHMGSGSVTRDSTHSRFDFSAPGFGYCWCKFGTNGFSPLLSPNLSSHPRTVSFPTSRRLLIDPTCLRWRHSLLKVRRLSPSLPGTGCTWPCSWRAPCACGTCPCAISSRTSWTPTRRSCPGRPSQRPRRACWRTECSRTTSRPAGRTSRTWPGGTRPSSA